MSTDDSVRSIAGHPNAIYVWHETLTIRRWIGADGLSFAEWHPSEYLEGGW